MTATVEQHVAERPRLLAIAYRMLGSRAEAEDAVGEAYLRLAQQEPGSVDNPAAWLTTVVTRLAVDAYRSARLARTSYVGPWLPEPLVGDDAALGGDPEEDAVLAETVSTALLVVLESLSPAERAVFVLHEAFGYGLDEVAAMLERTPAATRQLASRARRHVAEHRPRYEPDLDTRRRVVERFRRAATGGDVAALIEVLAPDVVLRSDGGGVVTAALHPVRGADKVARFVTGLLAKVDRYFPGVTFTFEEAAVNGTPGVLLLLPGGVLYGTVAFGIADGQVTSVDLVVNPEKLPPRP